MSPGIYRARRMRVPLGINKIYYNFTIGMFFRQVVMRVGSAAVVSLFNGAYGQPGLRTVRAGQQEGEDGLMAETRKKAVGYGPQPEGMTPRAVASQEKEMIDHRAIRAATGSGFVSMVFSGVTAGDSQADSTAPVFRDAGVTGQSEPDEATSDAVSDGSQAKGATDSREKEDAESDPAVSAEIAQLKQREQEVIAHEAAHKAVGGQYASAASYTYTTGPDGKKYIDGGEVSIHTPATNDPEEALKIAEIVRRAALAPANPSSQDISVAASASQDAAVARAEIARAEITEKQGGEEQAAGEKDAADSSLPVSGEDAGNGLTARENRQANRSALTEGQVAVSAYGTRRAAAAYASQLVVSGTLRAASQAFHAIG